MSAKHWRIFIDWDNDGTAETAEHLRTFDYSATRGRENLINSQSTGFGQQKVGKAVLRLINQDRRFDPFYTSGALFGSLLPERKVIIGVETDSEIAASETNLLAEDSSELLTEDSVEILTTTTAGAGLGDLLLETGDKVLQENGFDIYNSAGEYYARFTGVIDDLQQTMRNGERTAKITILDYWRLMRDSSSIWLDVIADTNTNDAIGAILDEIDWPEDDRDLNGDGDNLSYFWTTGQNADAEIWELVESNLGQVFFSNDGKLTYNERKSLYNTTEDDTITEAELHEDIQTPYLWRMIKNKIVVVAHPLTEQSTIELWRLYDIPLVKAGASSTLWCNLIYENRPIVATSVTTPAAGTDYVMNSQADGGGANLTANFSVTETKLGRRVKLVVDNDGTVDGYITTLKLRGDALDTPALTEITAEDTDSSFSNSVLTLDLLWQQSTESGKDYADWLVSWLNEPLLFPAVRLEDQDTLTLPYDLNTRVRTDLDTLEIDSDFYISKISERWLSPTGQGFEAFWQLEPADMSLYWQFTTELGISSRFAY